MFMEQGIKPIWVFDGKPPDLKADELEKRKELKQEAEQERKKLSKNEKKLKKLATLSDPRQWRAEVSELPNK